MDNHICIVWTAYIEIISRMKCLKCCNSAIKGSFGNPKVTSAIRFLGQVEVGTEIFMVSLKSCIIIRCCTLKISHPSNGQS